VDDFRKIPSVFGWLWRQTSSAPAKSDTERLIAEGNAAEAAGDFARACALYREAARLSPGLARPHVNLGIALESRGDAAGAQAAYERTLAIEPANAAANYNLGKLFYSLGRHADAEQRVRQAIEARPAFPEARVVLGYTLHALGKLETAASELETGIAGRPQDEAARAALSTVRGAIAVKGALEHHQAGRIDAAQAGYEAALALDPHNAEALFNIAGIHASRGQLGEAVTAYRRMVEDNPRHGPALCNLGVALTQLGRAPEALEYYRRAIGADPHMADAHYNLALAQRDAGQYDEALASLRRVIELRPDMAEAHFRLGNVLRLVDRKAEARAAFEQALRLDPEHVKARWSLTMSQLPAVYAKGEDPLIMRTAFAADLGELERWFDERRMTLGATGVGTDQPFELAYHEEDNRALLARYGALCTRLMDRWQRDAGIAAPVRRQRRPLRVGFVSAQMRYHSVWNALLKGWFRSLDPARFALYAFHIATDEDEETEFAKSRAAHYERGPKELRQWVDAITTQAPDVLIYPEIGMDPTTIRLASLRLAPLQAASWGHPETSGLPTIDCYLSGEALEPVSAEEHYTERLVALPHLGCYLDRLSFDAAPVDPARFGIDPRVPLLVCPGVPFKYAPQHDWVLPEIARRLGSCRLVFFSHWTRTLTERLAGRLRAAFAARSVDYDRYVTFIPWQTPAGFLGWLRTARVYLDTIGFSGFNTALHAVECSLPIVTREGRFLRGRLASGILKRLALDELVAPTEEAYIDLVVRLAQDADYHRSITTRMREARDVLYEDAATVRALEEFLLSTA